MDECVGEVGDGVVKTKNEIIKTNKSWILCIIGGESGLGK